MTRWQHRVHVECATRAGWQDFRRLLTVGVKPIGRFHRDGSVVILRPDAFAHLLSACEGHILGDAQCDVDCRHGVTTGGAR